MKISFQEIAELLSRVSGISTPIAGISWEPSKSELEVARNLIIFLENRRVLYEDFIHEDSRFVEVSIIEIRDELTKLLQSLGGTHPPKSFIEKLRSNQDDRRPSKSKLINNMREIRKAFIEFSSTSEFVRDSRSYIRIWKEDKDSWNTESREYFKALGKLRETTGFHIARIAVEYGIDVDEKLASIFPKTKAETFLR